MALTRAMAVLVVAGFAGAAVLAQSGDPMLGTWKLNVAKSKTTFKSGTTVIEAAGDAIKVTADLAAADGTAFHWTWTAKYDGKDNPVTGTTPYGATGLAASVTRVDPHTAKVVGKKDGKVVMTQTIVTAPDGKTRTVTTKGTDAKGQSVDTVAVYDKQ
jgi:hypothetical protein